MEIRLHPEHEVYQRDAALVATCRQAVDTWIAEGLTLAGPDGVVWTPQRARELVRQVAALFRQYNLVLWQDFDYCRRCQGGCCVPGASQVTAFDALALALLAAPFPELAKRASADDCIYLGAQGCRWPTQWRPIKCWAFYCLGSGDWELDSADVRYAAITTSLEKVLRTNLPHFVRQAGGAQGPLAQFLADPIAFAEALGAVLFELFVAPFVSRYRIDDGQDGVQNDRGMAGRASRHVALAFIAEAVERVWQEAPLSVSEPGIEQFLGDLERLEWIVQAQPQNMREELLALYERYREGHEPAAEGLNRAGLAGQMLHVVGQLLGDLNA